MHVQGHHLFDYGFSSAIACFVISSYLLLKMSLNGILILLCCDSARYMLHASVREGSVTITSASWRHMSGLQVQTQAYGMGMQGMRSHPQR